MLIILSQPWRLSILCGPGFLESFPLGRSEISKRAFSRKPVLSEMRAAVLSEMRAAGQSGLHKKLSISVYGRVRSTNERSVLGYGKRGQTDPANSGREANEPKYVTSRGIQRIISRRDIQRKTRNRKNIKNKRRGSPSSKAMSHKVLFPRNPIQPPIRMSSEEVSDEGGMEQQRAFHKEGRVIDNTTGTQGVTFKNDTANLGRLSRLTSKTNSMKLRQERIRRQKKITPGPFKTTLIITSNSGQKTHITTDSRITIKLPRT
ncbi:hypothetical protein CJ030_MR7G014363 [Morella rubra]|uniref:Uncharacterized protein n=1 Tax=Morella rubra TaxID=262757 RepID=A0A6A1V4K7_9ROSI|nr:hypothetical protein CJ030_MR7G014335 [Morella rubra]KAB1206218.1 hypothetical protein CJ030_MR7G014363 [Morella rubra]